MFSGVTGLRLVWSCEKRIISLKAVCHGTQLHYSLRHCVLHCKADKGELCRSRISSGEYPATVNHRGKLSKHGPITTVSKHFFFPSLLHLEHFICCSGQRMSFTELRFIVAFKQTIGKMSWQCPFKDFPLWGLHKPGIYNENKTKV